MLRNAMFNDWYTILIVVSLVFIATAKLLYSKRFNDFFEIFRNSNYLKIYLKDQKFINLFDGLLFANLILSLAIFVVISLNIFSVNEQVQVQTIELYYKLIVIIGAIILMKVLIDRLVGSLFEINEIMNIYVFQKITYKNYIGLILLPVNILLIFALNPSKTVMYMIIFLLLVVNVIGFIISVKSYLKVIKSNLFYFILYLCALEIAPYLILYKVF